MPGISRRELDRRRRLLLEAMEKRGIDALYIATPANITYLTGFEYIATERPFAVILKGDGELTVFCPLLEADHVARYAYVDRVEYYREYPDERHPMEVLADVLRRLGLEGKVIGYDTDGYGHVMGYRGPRLSEVFKNARYVYARDLVEELRMVKSDEEVRILRESARWTVLAHRLLQEYTAPGRYEDEVALAASAEATLAMIRALPGWRNLRALAGFRGQVGPHSYYPHSLSIHAVIKRGQVLVTGASARIAGYGVELERTMIVGRPSDEQRRFFSLMLEVRRVAFENIRPGARCSDVDRAVRRFFKEKGIWQYWRHHTGHGIGLEVHEAPFFDIGDDRVLRPGMVMSVEPGIYVPKLGGFRHSDTILIIEDGFEKLTEYPEELDDLVIED
ncbi:MAG: aminopeptidase P family protein [Thermoprotei archaeon]|nr:MAG: aminopeptidase P family protein [Thermoprotei archaeon]